MEIAQKTLTVVGMGMAGIGTAWNLSKNKSKINLILLEKSIKVGGRATSSSRHDFIYDHGANYFTFEGLENQQRVQNIIKHQLPIEHLAIINKDIYIFNKDNVITPSEQSQQTEKYTYQKGIMHLASLLKQDQNLNIQFEQHVDKLEYNRELKLWNIYYIDKKNNNNITKSVQSEYLLLTPPAPQILDLMKKSTYDKSEKVINLFNQCKYMKQIVIVYAFEKHIENLQYFALLNQDRQHDIVWITVEDQKQGHVPSNKSLLICQMSERFSDQYYNESDEIIQNKCNELIKSLIVEINQQNIFESMKFAWVKKWRYALPNNASKINHEDLKQFEDDGLFFAGDFLIGKGRVLQAFEKGLIVSDIIQSKL